MADLRLSWPTLAAATPEPGALCEWYEARWCSAGTGHWYTQERPAMSGFRDFAGVMVSDPATTHWRLAQEGADG
jgi:hypothetical protein